MAFAGVSIRLQLASVYLTASFRPHTVLRMATKCKGSQAMTLLHTVSDLPDAMLPVPLAAAPMKSGLLVISRPTMAQPRA